MNNEKVHRTTSADGTEIAGRVHGTGPPLVLVPGAMCDGEFHYNPLLPCLTDQFTCHAMSVRNRGLSSPSSDLTPERLVEDVKTYVESIGEPVALMGWSQGGQFALAAAERTDAVDAVAVFEPAVFEVLKEEEYARLQGKVGRMGELVGEDRLTDAHRTFVEWVANDDELAELSKTGEFFEKSAPNVPGFLQEVQQLTQSEAPSPTAPAELAKVSAPVLAFHGTRSVPDPWFVDGVRHVDEHLPNSEIREIPGAGHIAPYLEPEAVAEQLKQFFATPAQTV